MKIWKGEVVLSIVFILLSFAAGYIPPVIFLKWIAFVLLIWFVIRKIKKDQKAGNKHQLGKSILMIAIFIGLALASVPLTDVAKAKHNGVLFPFQTIHRSNYYIQEEIKDTFNFSGYIQELELASAHFQTQSDSVLFEGKYFKYLIIKHEPGNSKKKILIIASIHGDEPAGALSIPVLLRNLKEDSGKYADASILILSPMNPVGLAFSSRENEMGCNLNRDYHNPTQAETKRIISEIDKFKPDIILDLHENNGNWKTCIMANSLVSDELGKNLCEDLKTKSIPLAEFAFDTNLEIPGWHKRGSYRKAINYLAGLNDLMRYGEENNIPVITLESDQSLEQKKRIEICTSVVNALIHYDKPIGKL